MHTSTCASSWMQHLEAWRASDLSQNAYCRAHGLRPNQFSYWKRKLALLEVDDKPATGEPSSAFVPLHFNHQAAADSGLRLLLPNGCELSGIDNQHLPLVIGLMEALP